jgi:acetate kinase
MAVDRMTVVLTVNPGSSSLQLHVVETEGNAVLAAERSAEKADRAAAAKALDSLLAGIDTPITAAGHRLVHGGPHLRSPSVLTDSVAEQVRAAAELAPAHVPAPLELLEIVRERLPDIPHVLCPDTVFHANLPEVAATYALPEQWRRDFGIRRYGFHGLSYSWAVEQAVQLLHKPADSLNLLLAHLGDGSSVCAVRNGSSVDTSTGFTPLDGLPMSTRSGSVDPGMVLWLLDRMSPADVTDGLYHQSGLLGLSGGRSGDTRELVRAASDGDSAARGAMDVFTRRVSQALAAMAVNLQQIDALVFTGEIGWDQPEVREAVCADLVRLGIPPTLTVRNPGTDSVLSSPHAPVLVLAVQPHEELQIAKETTKFI